LLSIHTSSIPAGGGLSARIVGSIVDLNGNVIGLIDVNEFSCQWLQILHTPSDATYLREALYRVEDS
jgi:hypothetical protein